MTEDTDQLNDLLNHKYNYLKMYLKLSLEQEKNIDDEEIEQIEIVLRKKQEIIEYINVLDERYNSICEIQKSSSDSKPIGVIKIKETEISLKEILDEINYIETRMNKKAVELLTKLKLSCSEIAKGKRANSAYNPAPYILPSYFIDKKN